MFKRGFVSFAMLLSVTFVPTAPAYSQAAGAQRKAAPSLALPNPIFDFGTVREGTPVEASFTVRNDGDAPLEIKRIQPACGCTGAFVDSPVIQPAQQTLLKVHFDTTGFLGPKVKTIRLHTNEEARPSAVVTLRGTVQPEIEVDPIRVSFGDARRGAIPTRFFRVFADAATKVEVKEIASRSEHLALDVQDLNERGKIGKLVTVKLLDSAPLGPFRGRILIRTTSARLPVLNVNVFARVGGDVELLPSEIAFGLLDGPLAAPVTQKLQIRATSNTPVRVSNVRSETSAVDATLRTLNEGSLYEVDVTLPEGAEGVIRSKLQIELEHEDPAQRILTIPVYAIISKKGE